MSLKKEHIASWRSKVRETRVVQAAGKVTRVIGLTVEVEGIKARVGEVCSVNVPGSTKVIWAEVVGFQEDKTIMMPLGNLQGIYPECTVIPTGRSFIVRAGDHLLGKILDGLGNIVSENVPAVGVPGVPYPVDNTPPNPLERLPISEVLSTGVRSIDSLLTCGKGQRIGIFAGSGVGKSTLLGMISRYSEADVNVIGLVGERGREVLDFIKNDLGEEGLSKSVVVCATSDQPALVRLKGAFAATALAEYFRDQGKNVLLLMDSVTRFATAQREVGLAVGEPPATKGYTPSVFAALPRLLERSGTSAEGTITAFYTVLVDGDDMNEPIADAVRGILDGHIVLSRDLASRHQYPAIDVLNSISRLMPGITEQKHQQKAAKIKELLSDYKQSEDLINIGAYSSGSNPRVDEAIKHYDSIIKFLKQDVNERSSYENALKQLENIVPRR
ncbi:MAG: flagellar protein export ATPase FliI [Clostridiales bacterium]|nr:flagellar protein export ATPase FliI [Clostridiales bacterium]MCF8021719.1 flagellar protein export ATPase FliI [Clostridiales bacterium]